MYDKYFKIRNIMSKKKKFSIEHFCETWEDTNLVEFTLNTIIFFNEKGSEINDEFNSKDLKDGDWN